MSALASYKPALPVQKRNNFLQGKRDAESPVSPPRSAATAAKSRLKTLPEAADSSSYVGLKKEGELLSEANTQLTRSQTKKNDDTRSNKSHDRYSRVSSSRQSRTKLGLKKERKSVNIVSRK